MTTFLLIRHAAHNLGDAVIVGRSDAAHLGTLGQEQAAQLADRLARLPLTAIYCSPVRRARQTAQLLASRLSLPVQIRESLTEIDFGEWAGQSLEELRPQPRWQRWNTFRSGTRPPGGETMVEVQARIVGEMIHLRRQHTGQAIALVSHGDVIKSAVAHFLGVPLDLFHRIEIGLASVSIVVLAKHGPSVLCVNHTGALSLAY